jgi:beta-galactosidase/beta-glucuronidase
VAVDTWSDLGLHNYMGSVWYRTTVKLPAAAAGKKTYLWIGATDGRVKVYVNGKHVPYVDEKGMKADSFSGYCQPASVDISGLLKAGENRISLWCTREGVNELGTGGLLAAPVIYASRGGN